MFNSVKERIIKAKTVGKQIGRSWPAVICDVAVCRWKYGAILDDYLAFEFYKKNAKERDTFITEKDFFGRVIPKANSSHILEVFEDKAKFNHVFSDLIKREWIATEESSEDEIRAFMRKFPIVFVKETRGSQGLGVRRVSTEDEKNIDIILKEVKRGGMS